MPEAGLPSEKLPAAALGTFTVTSNWPFPASGSATEMAPAAKVLSLSSLVVWAAGIVITGASLAEPILTVTVACLLSHTVRGIVNEGIGGRPLNRRRIDEGLLVRAQRNAALGGCTWRCSPSAFGC